jgi:DNA topoisomerase-3
LAEKTSQAKVYATAFNVEKQEKPFIQLKSCCLFPEGAVITWGIGHLESLKIPGEYRDECCKWNLANLPIVPKYFGFLQIQTN